MYVMFFFKSAILKLRLLELHFLKLQKNSQA